MAVAAFVVAAVDHAVQGGDRVETILVAGVDSMIGANLAACLSGHQPIIGAAFRTEVAVPGCRSEVCRSSSVDAVRRLLDQATVDRVVYCGPGAEPSWSAAAPAEGDVLRVESWLSALDGHPAPFTLISSDAVFTGPWMFHSENSQSHCCSAEAEILRRIEDAVIARRPEALVLRTHAFGWSPWRDGWMEQLIDQLERGQLLPLDCVRHASPILVTDLIAVLQKAWQSGLTGTYHVAGAERINPVQFARKLSHVFALPFATVAGTETLTNRAEGFGRGEMSLQTRKIRRALGLGLPLLAEGLQRLHEQIEDGYRHRLHASDSTPRIRVA